MRYVEYMKVIVSSSLKEDGNLYTIFITAHNGSQNSFSALLCFSHAVPLGFFFDYSVACLP